VAVEPENKQNNARTMPVGPAGKNPITDPSYDVSVVNLASGI
jgi:hypothetical protein